MGCFIFIKCEQSETTEAEGEPLDEDALRASQVADITDILLKAERGTPVFKEYEPEEEEEEADQANDNAGERAGLMMALPVLGLYYYHPDHLGSSTYLTDASGLLYQFYLNLPFGETMAEQHSLTEDYETPYKFNGKELDTDTGYYYYGARYYEPRISVWLSTDPLMEKYPNINPYVYCYQNPINVVDPTGMEGESASPPTDYVDEKGKLLLRTNDGSNAVITVTKDKEEEFRNSVNSSDFGLDTKSWNFTMKKFLVGKWNQAMENNQSWYSTPEARGAVSRFWQTGDYDYWAYAANKHTGEARKDILAWGQSIAGGLAAVGTLNNAVSKLGAYELEITHGLTKSKNAFAKLKADIKLNGVQESIKFVEYNGKRYVVDGHHRLRAAKELGIQNVPVQQVKLPYAGYKSTNDLIYSRY